MKKILIAFVPLVLLTGCGQAVDYNDTGQREPSVSARWNTNDTVGMKSTSASGVAVSAQTFDCTVELVGVGTGVHVQAVVADDGQSWQ